MSSSFLWLLNLPAWAKSYDSLSTTTILITLSFLLYASCSYDAGFLGYNTNLFQQSSRAFKSHLNLDEFRDMKEILFDVRLLWLTDDSCQLPSRFQELIESGSFSNWVNLSFPSSCSSCFCKRQKVACLRLSVVVVWPPPPSVWIMMMLRSLCRAE